MQSFDLGALLEAIPDAVVVADVDAHIVYANAAVSRLLGWEPSALMGRHLHAIQPERMREPHDRGFGRWVTTGRSALFGIPIRLPALTASGEEVDVELNLAAITGPAQERLVIGVLRDLTERVELERQLSVLRYLKATTAAAARLWTRLDSSHVLHTLTEVLVSDFDAMLARAWICEPDDGVLRLVASSGLSTRVEDSPRARIDVASYPFKVGQVARDRQPFIRDGLEGDPQFDQAWVAREGIRSVACFPLLAGEELLGVMVSFSRLPLPDELAETIGHLAALAGAALNDARLVEQERDARVAADRARSRFELLAVVSERLSSSLDPEITVQAMAEAVVPEFADWCIVDLVGDDRHLEPVAWAHRTPALTERIMDLRSRYPPGERTSPPHAIYRAIESGSTICEVVGDDDLAARAVDPEHLALLRELGIGSHIVAVLASRGRKIGAVSMIRQPEREPFAEDDVATAEDIARRAALATDNALLYRSAQDAVELRDRFMAVASHELRTPLAVVHGHWELLARRLKLAEGAEARDQALRLDPSLRRLGRGIEQLRRLVEELLDVTRLTRGTLELQQMPVDVVALVRGAVDDAAAEPGMERVHLDLPPGRVLAMGDAARLRQVADNLIRNGLKYSSPDLPVQVSLATDGDVVRLRVADQGIGIPPQELETIFQPFNRARNASAQHYPGLGLGLAVSHEIITRLGGRIWAESRGEGKGSSFYVELARADGDAPADPPGGRE